MLYAVPWEKIKHLIAEEKGKGGIIEMRKHSSHTGSYFGSTSSLSWFNHQLLLLLAGWTVPV